MTITLPKPVAKKVISSLIKGDDYRKHIIEIIDAEFFKDCQVFFDLIFKAKLNKKNNSIDWYIQNFLNEKVPINDAINYACLNRKTVTNMFGTAKKEIALPFAKQHFNDLFEIINDISNNNNLPFLSLKQEDKNEITLSSAETFLVINVLAVKRASIRGGAWSTVGKRVESPLMQTLCCLYSVPKENYNRKSNSTEATGLDFEREIDFYLVDNKKQEYKCEVKLMGQGNPESADVFYARDSKIFVADKLSDTNKKQLNSEKINWVELRANQGFKRFKSVLENLNIPHSDIPKEIDIDKTLNSVFKQIFD